MTFKFVYLFIFLFIYLLLYCQNKETIEEIPVEESVEEDATIIKPIEIIDLNTATTDELLTIPGITPKIALNIVNYAIEKGFETVEDLKSVSGVTNELYKAIRRYFIVKPLVKIKPITTKLTFRFITRTPPVYYYENPEKFQNPYFFYNRAEFFLPNKTEFGFVVRQGADYSTFEPPTALSLTPENILKYGLISWWISFNNFGGVDKLVLGNYILNFGQGLIFYKFPADFESYLYTESKIRPTGIEIYKTSRKNAGFSGFALQKNIGNFSLFTFYSYKKLFAYQFNSDGSIANTLEGFDAGYGNPIKNIVGNIDNEFSFHAFDKLENKLLGGRVSFVYGKTKLGLTGFVSTYSPEINPPTSYGYHLFRGNKNIVYGLDFDTNIGKVNIFGEIAKSQNQKQDISQFKGEAAILGFMTSFNSITFVNKYFYYAPNYHNEYSGAHTFDYAPDMNQLGVFFETEYKHKKGKIKINYTTAKYPWINQKYKMFVSPHGGSNFFFEVEQNLTEKLSLYFRQANTYKEDKAYMYSSPVYGSIYKNVNENKYKTRVQLTWRLTRDINLRFRYDRAILDTYKYDFNTGIFYNWLETANLFFGEFSMALTENLSLSGRATIFNDAGPNGVYVSQVEPYWSYDRASWSPRFDYELKEASKYYLIADLKITKDLRLWLKYSNLFNYEYHRIEIPSREQTADVIKTNPQEIRLEYSVKF